MKTMLKKLESLWRHNILYPLLGKILKNPPYDDYIDITRVKKILFLRFDRIGDMIVTTPFFSFFKHHYPDIKIGVVASTKNAELLRFNKNVDEVYILSSCWLKNIREMLRIRREQYSIVLNLIFNRSTTVGLFSYVVARNAIKVGQGQEKHRFYFNKFFQLPRNTCHMTRTIATYIEKVFGFEVPERDLEFYIPVSDEVTNSVHTFLQSVSEKENNNRFDCVVLNLSAVDAERRITTHQAHALLTTLRQEQIPCVVIHAPGDNEMERFAKVSEKEGLCKLFPQGRDATLLELAALVGSVKGVITPDTSLIHFAAAMKTPVLGFYTQNQEWREWQPWNVSHISLIADIAQPVSSLSTETLQANVLKFIETITNK